MKFNLCILSLIGCTRYGDSFTFTGLATKHFTSSLRSSKNEGYSEELSGGIFFDGPSDFKVDASQIVPVEPSSPVKDTTSSSGSNKRKPNPLNTIPKDIVIIGGGLAGLSAALHMSLNSDRQITILEKEDFEQQIEKTTAGSFAAAGMLAPQSERLPSGPLLDLCLESREMYTEFIQTIESITANCSPDAEKYLWNDEGKSDLAPWEVGYASTGGFLAPAFAGDSVATWSPPAQVSGAAIWLDNIQIHEMEPSLHPEVVGGWWFPEDASVDARRLTCALRAACVERGVQFMYGENCGAGSLELGGGKCKGIKLNDGRMLSAKSVVVANGSWMRNLIPVPITPHKGQSFSLRMPDDTEPVLSRVLFAQDTYIVPKADGRIVVGATVEAGSFDPNVTPQGLMHCMSNAMQLVPGLGDLPMEETWAGLRPTTPDKGPILGRTKWDNLFIAGGYWRNGVLLAPKTGQLIGDLVLNSGASLEETSDEIFLEAFKWDRFTEEGGGKKLAANARYAASMHPVHKRSEGMGIATAVGTELGFYSGASAAREERSKDRAALFQDVGMSSSEEDAFEKAAMMGVTDASTFSFGSKVEKPRQKVEQPATAEVVDESGETKQVTQKFEGSVDALTIGVASEKNESDENPEEEIESIYDYILKNKEEASLNIEMTPSVESERLDPGFRIYHVDKDTREVTEIPPYTSPSNFFSNKKLESGTDASTLQKINEEMDDVSVDIEDKEDTTDPLLNDSGYDETTFDGYQTIQKANSRGSREEELEAMRAARMVNRVKASQIDQSKIGVMKMEESTKSKNGTQDNDISDIYSQIKANKEASASKVKMQDAQSIPKPDPGFRIYTKDGEEIPPYTSPQAFEKSKSK